MKVLTPMKVICILMISFSSLFAEPAELTKLRDTYQQKQKELTISYVKWLKKKSEESNGVAYEAYSNELKIYESNIDKPSTTEKNTLIQGKTITIKAVDITYRIGNLRVGDKIEIQYISGVWTGYPSWAKESPENPKMNQHGVSLVMKEGDVHVVSLPIRNTKEQPFEHVVEKEGIYTISMNATVPDGNDGAVSYKLNVIKK